MALAAGKGQNVALEHSHQARAKRPKPDTTAGIRSVRLVTAPFLPQAL